MNIIYSGIFYLNREQFGIISMVAIFLSGLFFPILLKLVFNRIIPPGVYRL
jgi:hypothetical protein